MTLVKLMVEVHISATITYSGMIVSQWIHYGKPQTSVRSSSLTNHSDSRRDIGLRATLTYFLVSQGKDTIILPDKLSAYLHFAGIYYFNVKSDKDAVNLASKSNVTPLFV